MLQAAKSSVTSGATRYRNQSPSSPSKKIATHLAVPGSEARARLADIFAMSPILAADESFSAKGRTIITMPRSAL